MTDWEKWCDVIQRHVLISSDQTEENTAGINDLLAVPETLTPETPIEASVPVVQAQPADSPVIEPRNIPAPTPVSQARVPGESQQAIAQGELSPVVAGYPNQTQNTKTDRVDLLDSQIKIKRYSCNPYKLTVTVLNIRYI